MLALFSVLWLTSFFTWVWLVVALLAPKILTVSAQNVEVLIYVTYNSIWGWYEPLNATTIGKLFIIWTLAMALFYSVYVHVKASRIEINRAKASMRTDEETRSFLQALAVAFSHGLSGNNLKATVAKLEERASQAETDSIEMAARLFQTASAIEAAREHIPSLESAHGMLELIRQRLKATEKDLDVAGWQPVLSGIDSLERGMNSVREKNERLQNISERIEALATVLTEIESTNDPERLILLKERLGVVLKNADALHAQYEQTLDHPMEGDDRSFESWLTSIEQTVSSIDPERVDAIDTELQELAEQLDSHSDAPERFEGMATRVKQVIKQAEKIFSAYEQLNRPLGSDEDTALRLLEEALADIENIDKAEVDEVRRVLNRALNEIRVISEEVARSGQQAQAVVSEVVEMQSRSA